MGLPAVKAKGADEFNVDRKELGPADTLRYNVATFVVEEKYDRAIEELRAFLDAKTEFPKFRDRVSRYVDHSIDLINAIRAKRKFPGAASLTMAKQQELKDRFHQHFEELQQVLKNIERIHSKLKVDDIRSTVWVVRTLMNSIFVIFAVAFALEASRGLGTTMMGQLDDFFILIVNKFF
jgi:hypothetical protein